MEGTYAFGSPEEGEIIRKVAERQECGRNIRQRAT